MQTPNDANQEPILETEEVLNEEITQEVTNETTETVADDPLASLAEMKDKYVRLYAEFENFRRRTAKEKIDLIKNAGEDVIKVMLPILDDFDRAQKSFANTETLSQEAQKEISPIKEGVQLIYQKIYRVLEQKGLKQMESTIGKVFDVSEHESITQIPAPTPDMQGKVIDEVEKGYQLNDKVIRFAKVVVGS